MAINDTWVRVRATTPITLSTTDVDLLDVPLNDTLLRVHGAVEVSVTVPGQQTPSEIFLTHIVAGLYTTLTTGGILQDPSSNPGDFAPPLQRWLWWEQLEPQPQPTTNQAAPDTRQQWIYRPSQIPIDVKAQVRATTAVSLHFAIFRSHTPQGVKTFDLRYWFSMLRSGL